MNKTIAVRNHLEEYGKITTWEAIKEYGATRLSAIIFNLRHRDNMNIGNREVIFTDRYGHKSSFAEYYLIRGEENV